MRRKRRCVLLLLFCCLVAAFPFPGPSARSAEAEDAKNLIETYPDANSVILNKTISFEVQSDGKYRSTTHYKAAVLNRQGIEEQAQYTDSYCSLYDTLTVDKASVTNPDGSTTELGKEDIKDIPIPAVGPFFLQNVRLVVVTFPALKIGCTVEVRISATRSDPPMDNQFSLLVPLCGPSPVKEQIYTVSVPEEMSLRWKAFRGEIDFSEEKKEGRNIYRWEKKDSPRITEETSMPPIEEVSPVLLVTTIASWPDVSRWYFSLAENPMAATPDVSAQVNKITAPLKTTDEKIEALFYWVSRNIRYVETTLSGEKAGFKPEPAEVTLKNRYGVCRDKAALLASMLRSIGVDAYVALVTAGIKRDPDLPNIEFNHAITAVREPDGTTVFMDPTAEDTREFLPFNDQDKYAIVCSGTGEGLTLTPIGAPEKNLFDVRAKSKIFGNGKIESDVTIQTKGLYDFLFRSQLNRIPPERREMMVKMILRNISPAAVLQRFTLSNLDDLKTPLECKISFIVRDHAVRAGDYLLFQGACQKNPFDVLTSELLRGADLPQRTFPLRLLSTLSTRTAETIEIPEGYSVKSLPEKVRIDEGRTRFQAEYAVAGNSISFYRELTLAGLYFEGKTFDRLRAILAETERVGDGRIILLKKVGSEP